MSTYTENYSLIKPDAEDFYNIDDFNENMDVIDETMTKQAEAILLSFHNYPFYRTVRLI